MSEFARLLFVYLNLVSYVCLRIAQLVKTLAAGAPIIRCKLAHVCRIPGSIHGADKLDSIGR